MFRTFSFRVKSVWKNSRFSYLSGGTFITIFIDHIRIFFLWNISIVMFWILPCLSGILAFCQAKVNVLVFLFFLLCVYFVFSIDGRLSWFLFAQFLVEIISLGLFSSFLYPIIPFIRAPLGRVIIHKKLAPGDFVVFLIHPSLYFRFRLLRCIARRDRVLVNRAIDFMRWQLRFTR